MDDVLHYLATTIGSSPIHRAVRAHQEARTAARRYRRQAAKLIARIERAAAAGDHTGAAHLRGVYIDSLCARFVAAEVQNKDFFPDLYRRSTLELVELAKRLNARRGTSEPVHVHFKGKKSGGYRPICVFDLENRILQQVVLTALQTGMIFHPAQFNVPNRGGLIAARRAVHDAYASGLYKYVVQLDVRDCYPSITAMGVAENLPIPKQVTNAVVMLDNLHLTLVDTIPTARRHRRAGRSALSGLPQGSICSTIVQSILLKPLLNRIPASAFAAMWADNLIILFRTKAEAERTLLDLHQAARDLPSGALQLTDGGIGRVSGSQEFIGSTFQRRKGKPTSAPTAENKDRFTAKAREILSQPPSARDQAYRSLARGFQSQHRLWSAVESWTALRRYFVEAHMRPDFRRLRSAVNYFRDNL